MSRVKRGPIARARRKKVLKRAEGFFGSKHRLYKTAQEQLFNSGAYSYNDRKKNKSKFRKLWITRINAACRENDISYSKFINGLNTAGIEINRKMLSELAISDSKSFSELVKISKEGKNKKVVKPISKEIKEQKKEVTDLSKLTVATLKNMAKEKGISNYTTMKKAELLEVLK